MASLVPILAVDDSASIREMIALVLEPHGYQVITASNGQEALRKLHAATEPHIILLDVVMPLMDGIALCNIIKSDPLLRNAGHHIVLMSSTSRLAAPDVPGAVSHLAKPFSRQDLITTVNTVR
ncbi:MAG: hypothetical protein OJF49_000046 [Ktedonobacterales bacterium]|jgi:CheY-like chemotaxis protein|nr:MAG: hypothetical protein OJF49_000046 [Ktedonobacterales bacterium]